jgi:malate dehydrogenase (oxaloacetate-decarboxylating)
VEEKEGGLETAIKNANVFIGLSKPNVLSVDMVKSMAPKPIIFALANPNPEITPEKAFEGGAFVVATGRSDYPNQINNSLVFPGAFKAMLDKKIPQFENKIFITIAEALALVVENPTPEKIIPSMFDSGVKDAVYNAVSSLK